MARTATYFHRRARINIGISLSDIVGWFEIARQRRELNRLDAHVLDDIGVSRTEAEKEARRPFWDAPAHWRD